MYCPGFILIPDNQCSIRITRFSVKFTVLVLGRVGEVIPELQSQLVAQLRSSVPTLNHGLHLKRKIHNKLGHHIILLRGSP